MLLIIMTLLGAVPVGVARSSMIKGARQDTHVAYEVASISCRREKIITNRVLAVS